jgi:D-alanyl-D-alanine carboxypeptidase/D-alanyl-D-alanine-endopeptidase (penicillin-binding protein 4)
LGDSIPALRYYETGDSLVFKGTGDPSFLYKNVFDSRVAYDFLSNSTKKLYLSGDNFFTEALGPGWAWDDLQDTYSSERSSFPVYGNFSSVVRAGHSLSVIPQQFSYEIAIADSTEVSKILRDLGSNKIIFHPGRELDETKEWEIPFKTSVVTTTTLLSDTLKKSVDVLKGAAWSDSKTLYSIPADSLYKVMMQESDNFMAEQLLLICAEVLSDSLKPEIAINYMKKNHLNDLPDNPVWVDGSGLSRYNLFTPSSIVKLWEKIYERVPRERLFQLVAIGGKAGTIKSYFKIDPPFIYGKTGTLSNVRCLSGYLVTKKGKTFIFSFMGNNHPTSTRAVQNELEPILKSIYEHY